VRILRRSRNGVQNPRVDHAAGVTGELVETGMAKFRPKMRMPSESPYADVKTDDGAVHRLWGVSLPKALEEGGVSEGDTVTLRKDGVERVTVTVPVIDEKTGEQEFRGTDGRSECLDCGTEGRRLTPVGSGSSARATGRNCSNSLSSVLAGPAPRRRRSISRARKATGRMHRISRGGAASTCVSPGSVAGMEEGASRRLAWIAEKREQVAKLWERASVALGFAIERERRVSYNEDRSETLAAEIPSGRKISDPAHHHVRPKRRRGGTPRAARFGTLEGAGRDPSAGAAKIYRDPDDALARLNALASDARIEPRRLAEDLETKPQRLGRLRGSELLVDGRAARAERDVQRKAALPELLPLARAHATEFRRQAERFGIREEQRRAHMSLSVPALSKPAMARLVEIEAVRERGGQDAYKTAFTYAVADRSAGPGGQGRQRRADRHRFGWSAFTAKSQTQLQSETWSSACRRILLLSVARNSRACSPSCAGLRRNSILPRGRIARRSWPALVSSRGRRRSQCCRCSPP
jgi:hypothetical protein